MDDNASAASTANERGDDKPRQGTPYDRFAAEQPKDDGRGNAGFEEIAIRMAAEKVTISTVTLGERPDLECPGVAEAAGPFAEAATPSCVT